MNAEFKTALRPYLFNGVYIEVTSLSNIQGWPEIVLDLAPEEMAEYEDGQLTEPLNLENHNFISYTDTSLKISCGGDWQHPHTVVIALVHGQIIIESCEKVEYVGGVIDDHELEAMFTGIRVRPPAERPVAPTPKWVIEMDLRKAINREDYQEAARLRDILATTFPKLA